MINERQLIRRARKDPDAFILLYDEYYPRIYAFALSRAGHKQRAEDVTQQTFLTAMEKIGTFTWYKPGSFASWLFRIARNKLVDEVRKQSKIFPTEPEKMEQIELHTPSVEELALTREDEHTDRQHLDKLFELMRELSQTEQEILSLRYFSHLSFKDIAAILKKKPNTLIVAHKRALAKLKANLTV